MRTIALASLLAGSALLAGCATTPPPAQVASTSPCGTAHVDVNNDGMISGPEWNTWRSGAFAYWDVDRDGRIDRSEFENCWRAGGFYRDAGYSPDYWTYYWTAFDTNNDGYLNADEYWSAATWSRIDRNGNGIIDSSEWIWWGS